MFRDAGPDVIGRIAGQQHGFWHDDAPQVGAGRGTDYLHWDNRYSNARRLVRRGHEQIHAPSNTGCWLLARPATIPRAAVAGPWPPALYL